MDPYITTFHDLGGNTSGEHKKNFNAYLSTLKSVNPALLQQIIANLNPNTLQEEIFHVKILTTFKHYDKLLETFQKGNIILNRIIINTGFSEIFSTTDAEGFTKNICPNISAVMRWKMINKLARMITDPKVGDTFYAAVSRRYGLKTAENLLVCCSEEIIRESVLEYKTHFSCKQLIRLHGKFPGFLKFYLKNISGLRLKEISLYLAVNDIHGYHENFKSFSYVKIGRKGFNNFLIHYKTVLLEDPAEYFKIIHADILVRKLTQAELVTLITNLLPATNHGFNYYDKAYQCIKMLPLQYRGVVFSEAYKNKYGTEVFEQEVPYEFISQFHLEIRLKFGLHNQEHLPLFSTTVSIPKIKTLIIATSDRMHRKNFLLQLLETCRINRDFDALLEVLNYINQRHKNEILTVKMSVLHYLMDNFKLEHLKQAHWDCINEFEEISTGYTGENVQSYSELIQRRIHFKILNGIDFAGDLVSFIKLRGKNGKWNLLKRAPKLEKLCLIRMSEMIPASAEACFFKSLRDYNRRHQKRRICYFDYPEKLETFLCNSKERDDEQDVISDVFLTNCLEHAVIQADFRRRYVENNSSFLPKRLRVWLLNNETDFVVANLPTFLERCEASYAISKMHFAKIHQITANYYMDEFNRNKNVQAGINFFSHSKDFIQFANKFNPPTDGMINLQNGDTKKVLNIQRSILRSIKNYPLLENSLEIILNYAKGDYLQFALQPLYFACYHIPEKHLDHPLLILSKRAVSARKHAIHLTLSLSNIVSISSSLSRALEMESNASVKKFITKSCFKLFCKNPSDQTMQLLKNSVSDDPEIIALLHNFSAVNTSYLPDYLKLVWNVSECIDFKSLLETAADIILKLDNEFCDELLTKSLLYEENWRSVTTRDFICNYLLHAGEALEQRTRLFCDCIVAYVRKTRDFEKIIHNKGDVYLLLEWINLWMLKHTPESLITLKTLQKHFNNPAIASNGLIYELLFDVTLFFIANKERELHKSLAKFLYDYNLRLIDRYEVDVSDYYKEFLKHYLRRMFFNLPGSAAGHCLLLAEELLEMEACLRARLLAVFLLPDVVDEGSEDVKRCRVLVEKLGQLESPVVLLYLEKYLRGF